MGKLPRKKSFRYLIEALSQKQLFKLLELETDEYGGVFHLIALHGVNSDILSILIEKIPQKMLFELLQKQKANSYMPFQIAALFNLEMVLLLIKKMSSDQLYTLLTMGLPYHATPFNYIVWEHERGTEISKKVIYAIIDKLLDSQFFNLISAQLKFEKGCNWGADNLVLIVKAIPETSRLSNYSQLCKMNEFKKQMLKQLCSHLHQDDSYLFLHTELYDENSYSLRIFFMHMKDEKLYQATYMKDYDGFILSKSLLHTILNYNRLEFNSLHAISRSKCLELISMEKCYGYKFYQIESSDHLTVLVSMKKLPKGMYKYSTQQFINDAKFLSNSAANKKAVVIFKTKDMLHIRPKLDIAATLNCMINNTLTPERNLDTLRNLHLLVASNAYKVDLHSLVNLFMPLISSKRTYKEQIFVDGSWVENRAVANIEEVSANEIIERGKRIYAGNKELLKYKNRMYEYQEVPCLGAETIELLIDQGLFLSYIKTLSDLYLQSIDLSDQEYREQQKELARYFIESGNGFFLSRRSLTSTFSQVLQKVFPNGGIDVQTIGLLLFYDKISSYIEIISSFTTEPDYQVERITMMLYNMEEDIVASINEFVPLYKQLIRCAIERFGEVTVEGWYGDHKEAGDFLYICGDALCELYEQSDFKHVEDVLLGHCVGKYMEGIIAKVDSCQNLLNNFLQSVDINEKTVQQFIDSDYKAHYFNMIINLYLHLSDESIEESKTIGFLSQCGSDFLLTQSDFQSSCHGIIHQIFDQIYKQSKRKQSVNSELKDSSVSALSQKASKLNVIG